MCSYYRNVQATMQRQYREKSGEITRLGNSAIAIYLPAFWQLGQKIWYNNGKRISIYC